jgi:hypothetical protein
VIGFAAGAFIARLGLPPEAFIGRHVSQLIAPVDQIGFGAALAMTASRGRSPAFLVRLSDRRQSPVTVASLLVPGPPTRLCLTFGGVPAFGGAEGGGPASMASGTGAIVDAAARRMRDDPDGAGRVGFLELRGWAKARETLTATEQSELRAEIGAALAAVAPGSLSSRGALQHHGAGRPRPACRHRAARQPVEDDTGGTVGLGDRRRSQPRLGRPRFDSGSPRAAVRAHLLRRGWRRRHGGGGGSRGAQRNHGAGRVPRGGRRMRYRPPRRRNTWRSRSWSGSPRNSIRRS